MRVLLTDGSGFLTPFAHVGLVPAQPLRAAAAIQIGIGLAAAVVMLWAFRRRDLLGA